MLAKSTPVVLSDSDFSRCEDTGNGYFSNKCWYTVQDIDLSTYEWKGEVTNDDLTDYLVCGLRATVSQKKGIYNLYFFYCKVNDWSTTTERTIGTTVEAYDNPIVEDKTIMCSNDYYVTGFGTSQGTSDGTTQGIT